MPQVPYQPIPTVQPSGQGTPSVSENTPIAAFGGTVAAGLEGLGKAVEHSGDELFKRAVALQELRNETEATESIAQYEMKAGELHAKYSSLEGKAAVEGQTQYNKDLQDLRVQIRDGMSNDAARKIYDRPATQIMGRSIFNGAGHAATENKRWALGSVQAQEEASANYVHQNPQDDIGYERAKNKIIQLKTDIEGPIRGQDEEQLHSNVNKATSQLLAARIIGLSKTEPFKAEEMLNKNREGLYLGDVEKVEGVVRQQLRNTGARVIANKQDISAPLQEQLDAGAEEAKKLSPNDDLFPDFVEDRIRARYNKAKADQHNLDFTNKNTIEGALMGGSSGTVPTTIEELKADPKVEAAFNELNETQQRHYIKQLAANAKGDNSWTSDGLRQYNKLKGMANNDPAEFMATDVVEQKLPNSAKRELINLQQRLHAKVEGDPRVTRAMQMLRPSLLDPAGITKAKDADGLNRFTGALQDALDQFQQDTKKQPDYKQVQEIGARLLQEQHDPNKWSFGFMNRTSPLIELAVPDDVAEKIKADPAWAEKGIEPTDEMIRRVYVRKRYQELYGGKDKTPAKQIQDRFP